jgi:hypothetical protein
VVVRWTPGLSVRCGTRVARPHERTLLAPKVMGNSSTVEVRRMLPARARPKGVRIKA